MRHRNCLTLGYLWIIGLLPQHYSLGDLAVCSICVRFTLARLPKDPFTVGPVDFPGLVWICLSITSIPLGSHIVSCLQEDVATQDSIEDQFSGFDLAEKPPFRACDCNLHTAPGFERPLSLVDHHKYEVLPSIPRCLILNFALQVLEAFICDLFSFLWLVARSRCFLPIGVRQDCLDFFRGLQLSNAACLRHQYSQAIANRLGGFLVVFLDSQWRLGSDITHLWSSEPPRPCNVTSNEACCDAC